MNVNQNQVDKGLEKLKANRDKNELIKKHFDPTNDLSLTPKRHSKRGLAAKPLLESDILDAQSKARSASEAARILGVSYPTYKKYAQMYGIFENLKNPTGIGISKGWFRIRGDYTLEDILEGKHPKYPIWKLKHRLLNNGYMLEECSVCGFKEKRIIDYKTHLILDHIDDDRTNHKYENLRLLCYNCSFLIRGNFTKKSFKELYY